MNPSAGLVTALNAMREMSVNEGKVYHQYVPVVTDSTSIGEFGTPILDPANTAVLNDFVGLLKKIVYTAVSTKVFNNPLEQLEGEALPLGQFIENTYVNPARARKFNVNDFAGLLQKYEAEVAVEYLAVNSDLQYQVTITRDKIRNAFTSWSTLEDFISGLINSLYNGAYIDRYNATKGLITSAYTSNKVQVKTITNPTNEATAKTFIKEVRATLSKMKVPSINYNAWNKLKPNEFKLKAWSDPADMIVFLSADVDALTSVEVLARAFNMSETDFLARVIVVDDFNITDAEGNIVVDGSAIKAMVCDRAWFKIKTQDFQMDEFYNANNRTWQYYLNDVRMYNYSLFANAVIFATELPDVDATKIEFPTDTASIAQGESVKLQLDVTPPQATTAITYAVSAAPEGGATTELTLTPATDGKSVTIKAAADATAGNYTVTATAGELTDTATITVTGS